MDDAALRTGPALTLSSWVFGNSQPHLALSNVNAYNNLTPHPASSLRTYGFPPCLSLSDKLIRSRHILLLWIFKKKKKGFTNNLLITCISTSKLVTPSL